MSEKQHHPRWDRLKDRLQHSSLATAEAPVQDEQRKHELYRQRAQRLAAPADDSAQATAQQVPTLIFVLGDDQFGIPLRHIAQVCPAQPLTPVPRAPAWLLGIAGFDARIRSVVDMAALLEVADRSDTTGGHILLVHAADSTVAARVDRVEEVRLVDFAELSAPDQLSDAVAKRFIHGVAPQHVAMVCAETLLAHTVSPHGVPAA